MNDIPDFVMYIMIVILAIIAVLFVLKYKYHWRFVINIGKIQTENKTEKEETEKEQTENQTEQKDDKQKVIDEVIEKVDKKIENFEEIKEEEIKETIGSAKEEEDKIEGEEIKEEEVKEDPAIKTKKTLDELIEEKVQEKVEEKLKDVVKRNNDEVEVRNKFNTYNVMLNEPVGRLKQSKLMIDQLINKDMDRYYGYVKPIKIEDNNKDAYNKNTFCLKCNSKDQDYSNYFYTDPLEYANDKLEGTDEGIKAYNI